MGKDNYYISSQKSLENLNKRLKDKIISKQQLQYSHFKSNYINQEETLSKLMNIAKHS